MKMTILKKTVSMVIIIALICSFVPFVSANGDAVKILHYTFETGAQDECGNFDGEIFGNVEIENGYAYFDGAESYIEIPKGVISNDEMTFVINVRPEMGPDNQFTFTFGNSEANGYFFLNTNRPNAAEGCRAAITPGSYWEERDVTAEAVEQGEWASIAIVFEGTTMRMYKNGILASENKDGIAITSLGDTERNYIARSQYNGDQYFKGYIDDFIVYEGALSESAIETIAIEHAAQDLEYVMSENTVVLDDISLPDEILGVKVEWKSENPDIISADGFVTRQEKDTDVVLIATLSDKSGNKITREFTFTVIHEYTDEEKVELDLESFFLVGNLEHLKEDLYLPKSGNEGTEFIWQSSDESVITNEGKITQLPVGEGSQSAALTLTVKSGDVEKQRSYDITVEEEDYAYLFAYFTGNAPQEEKMFYGLSRDGYYFNAINGGKPVLEETVGTQCLRDPFIFRGQDGIYYCLATDMRSSTNSTWDGDTAIVTWSSKDLIHWENETLIDFSAIEGFENVDRAWAPQAIWDPEYYDETTGEYGAYMIYLALRFGRNSVPTQMYKVYTNDMQSLISTPEFLYSHGEYGADIDSDIVYKNGLYYMYVKDEDPTGKLIYVVTSEHAGGPYSERIEQLPSYNGDNIVGVEGSAIYKKIGEDKYLLIYDAYNSGFFVMSETEDLVTFNQLPRNTYGFDFTPRHGYVVTISKDECDALMEVYGKVLPEETQHEDPILYYDFEDKADKSGSGYDAKFNGRAEIKDGGIAGSKGLYLDGTVGGYVDIPSQAVSSLSDYTVSAWINPDRTTATQRVFDFGTGDGRYMFLTPYNSTGNTLRYAMTVGGYGLENGISVDTAIPTGKWTHVAVTSTGDKISLYINGVLQGEIEGVELDPYEISSNMPNCYIGKSQFAADAYYAGYIDEFMIYDRGLSADEVSAIYAKNALTYTVEEKDGAVTVSLVGNGCDESVDVVIAEYNEDGILTGIKHEKVTFTPEVNEAEVKMELTESKFKAFVFESLESMRPVKN